ncbi:MAG TPA: anthranilate synthase component I family protein [Pirellulales bacterium]|jgi:para-aminobenzoate synthetase component 1|nr:anthranilate synthase component I family protein [Pirellulales bacterium]
MVVPLGKQVAPEEALLRLAHRPHALFLDSARHDAELGRYSFLAADPFDFLTVPTGLVAADGTDALALLAQRLAPWQADTVPGLPPFQGGAAGLWAYDLNRSLEQIAQPAFDEFAVPALAVGLYDVVLALDHRSGEAWIISQGFPEREPAARRRRASERARQFESWLAEPAPANMPVRCDAQTVAADRLAPSFATAGPAGLISNFSAAGYVAMVERAIDYIRAGDIFQANLSQRLLYPARESAVELYLRLRRCNPAPFAGYFDLGEFQIASASPERFLKVVGGEVETRPIKGTRQRTRQPEADLFAGDELSQSEKDRAENVMIVDLMRNDLAKVCQADSVRVTQLCRLESYAFVQHLVSAVRGRLKPDRGVIDLLRATFPGGSISGAPKVRAMQIIAELEPTARGAYCGALGYIGFDGSADTNLLIRTVTAGRGWWQAPVGGGIVAQSHPQREYEETWHKAAGLLRALEEKT